MAIEKLDVSKIRGNWQEMTVIDGKEYLSGGNDTIESMQRIAEKVNEIIDSLAHQI